METLVKHITLDKIILLVSAFMFGSVKVQSGDRNHRPEIFNGIVTIKLN